MAFSFTFKCISLLLLLTASISFANESSPKILDLSQPFHVGNVDNSDAVEIIDSNLTEDTGRFLVIDDGEIVLDYQNDNIDDDKVYELWSATKAIMSTIIGTIISSDEYDLSLDDTLGDIFTGENDWNAIEDPAELEFKQNITVYEMLTMTSGMFQDLGPTVLFIPNPLQPADLANAAGINLEESLAFHTWNATMKGEFSYMATSNVLSYVVVAVTGMTPREYVSVDVFPSLGIDMDDVVWDQNFQGVETSFSNLKLKARDMAKIPQLFLQKGLASPDGKRLLSEEFVEMSVSEQVTNTMDPAWHVPYGLLWNYIELTPILEENGFAMIGTGMWCGTAIFGQAYCFNYESKRIVVFQKNNPLFNFENTNDLYRIAGYAFSLNATFSETVETIETVESGALSPLSISGLLFAISSSWIAYLF